MGWTYNGKGGGPIRTETPTRTCARDSTGIVSSPTAINNQQSKRAIRMMLTSLGFAGLGFGACGRWPDRPPHLAIVRAGRNGLTLELRRGAFESRDQLMRRVRTRDIGFQNDFGGACGFAVELAIGVLIGTERRAL